MTKPEIRIRKFEKWAYGMFIHWGLYSILGKGEWAQHFLKIPISEYSQLKGKFKARNFDARKIAAVAKESGMRYITLTTRHHDGFSLYDTCGLNDFDAPHSAAGRDLVEEFVKGCRAENIVPFFYHTTLDWYQKSYKADFKNYLDYLHQSIELLCRNYGPIGGFWFDGDWDNPNEDWKWNQRYAIIRKYQPDAIIINNTGLLNRGEAQHKEIDSVTFERGRPIPLKKQGMKKYVATEMCQTANTHWGVAVDDYHYMSPRRIIEDLCACRKVGANYLMNIGLTGSGKIPSYESTTFRLVSKWLEKYAKAFFQGRPCAIQGQDKNFALQAKGKIYFFVYDLIVEGDNNVVLGLSPTKVLSFTGVMKKIKNVRWLDNNEELNFSHHPDNVFSFEATKYPYGVNLVVRVAEAS